MLSLVSKIGFGILLIADSVQASCSVSPVSKQSISTLLDCLNVHHVPYLIPTSPNWAAYETPFNLRLQYTPTAITVPENIHQVSASVKCAAAAGVKVQAKGGGHSYASYSSGGQNGSLVIEMQNFNNVTMDYTTWIVKVGAGQRLGNVAQAIYREGQRAMPHGTCAGVGIAGHALHGGYGYDSRKWGLALDQIVGLEVVLANGTFVYTDAKIFPDIFWAMRGAGDSFGIATHFYMQTQPAPREIISFSANLEAHYSNAAASARGFEALQDWSLTSSDLTPNITFGTYADSNGIFSFRGWCMDCNEAVFRDTVFPEMLAGWPLAVPTVETQGWIAALTAMSYPDPLTQPLGSDYQLHDTFYAKSVVSKNAEPLNPPSLPSYFRFLIKNQKTKAPGSWFSIINLYGAPGSAINAIPADTSAYSDRDSLWVFQNYATTGNSTWEDELTTLIDGMNNATTLPQPTGEFSGYMNYVDPNLSPANAHLEYYGASTYDKLLGLKYEYDPNCVFWSPQAIGTSVLAF